ncbi:MAG: hypothetical protein JXR13_18645 [Thalassovita sp.]
MNDQTKTDTALALPVGADLAKKFSDPKSMDDMLARIETEVLAQAPDTSNTKGRAAIRSLAHKVAQSKTALDKAGKDLNEKARAEIAAVDAERRKVRVRLDDLKTKVRAPLNDWETKEEARKAKLNERLALLSPDRTSPAMPSAKIKEIGAEIENTEIGSDWDEFLPRALAARESALTKIGADLLAAEQREANEAELAVLREAAAKSKADKIERERKEAEAIALRKQQDREREEAERAEQQRREDERLAAERAEQAKRDAEARAQREQHEREAELIRQKEEAERIATEAAEAERARIAAEKQREDEARAQREADENHRAKIHAEITAALATIPREQTAQALMDGKVPHVKVMI